MTPRPNKSGENAARHVWRPQRPQLSKPGRNMNLLPFSRRFRVKMRRICGVWRRRKVAQFSTRLTTETSRSRMSSPKLALAGMEGLFPSPWTLLKVQQLFVPEVGHDPVGGFCLTITFENYHKNSTVAVIIKSVEVRQNLFARSCRTFGMLNKTFQPVPKECA